MFQAIEMRGFRGFRQLNVEPLERFNLVIGRNNVGKTAFLEAAFLLLGPNNPELPLRVNAFRGIESFRNEPEELWGWLFHDKDITQAIELNARASNGLRRLRITLKEPKDVRFTNGDKRSASRQPHGTTSTADTSPAELLLNYRSETGAQIHTKAYIKETGLGFERSRPVVLPTSVFVTAKAGYVSDNAERFSKLEEVGRQGEIVPALQMLEPRLKRLAVLATASGPMIHGDIGSARMVPLPFMGEGTGKLLTLLLAIVSAVGGVVLVDEVESGFHYSVMQSVWAAMREAARQSNVQILATTHSWECLKAAHQAFASGNTYDLRVHRLTRNGDGGIQSQAYDQEMIEASLESGVEIR